MQITSYKMKFQPHHFILSLHTAIPCGVVIAPSVCPSMTSEWRSVQITSQNTKPRYETPHTNLTPRGSISWTESEEKTKSLTLLPLLGWEENQDTLHLINRNMEMQCVLQSLMYNHTLAKEHCSKNRGVTTKIRVTFEDKL